MIYYCSLLQKGIKSGAGVSRPDVCPAASISEVPGYKMKHCRLPGLLAAFLLLAALFTLPASAEDYDTVLDSLSRLQSLAQDYAAEHTGSDPVQLTLSYTRSGSYNTTVWSMVAPRSQEFVEYVDARDSSLSSLIGLGSLETPGGSVDFGHLLASMDLVSRGLPITGSWGGDCMELARQYLGQASDAEGYVSLMSGSFDSGDSMFGGDDLRADMDAILIGSQLTDGAGVADTIRSYYSSITDYDRAYRFIALSFGNVNTGDTAAFREKVYSTLTGDTGMQLLLFMNDMMSTSDGWAVSADAVPALQGASYVLADYLSGAVEGAQVTSDSDTRMMTMAAQALSDALNSLGYGDAASAVLDADSASGSGSSSSSSAPASSSNVFSGAAATIQSGFNLQVFETVLLVIGAAAVMLLLICVVMLVRRR